MMNELVAVVVIVVAEFNDGDGDEIATEAAKFTPESSQMEYPQFDWLARAVVPEKVEAPVGGLVK